LVTFIHLILKRKYHGERFPVKWGFKTSGILVHIAQFIFLFILAALIILLIKQHKRVEFSMLESPFFIFIMGLLTEILIVPAIVLLVISIIGIPFIPLLILGLISGLAFGWATVVNYVGKWVSERVWKREINPILNVLIGLTTISIIPLIHLIFTWANVNYINTLFGFLRFIQNYVILTFALGGVLMSRFGTMVFVKNKSEKKQSEEISGTQN